MKSQKLLFALFLSLNVAAASAGQSEISAKLGKMADTLIVAYDKTPGALEKPKAAVMTFNTSKELEKQRIGFAVSEILSHNLAEKGSFVLLERTELNRVFDELKLNMAGVTNQADALKAGKLASAEILVMGSVEKFDGTYHVNARLVKTETGEVLATAYEELPVKTFENEAKDYVMLVPKTQTLGLYFLYNYRGTAKLPQTYREYATSDFDYTAITTPEQTAMWTPGVGLRYTPVDHITLDLSFANSGSAQKTGRGDNHYTIPPDYTMEDNTKYTSKLTLLRGLIGIEQEFSRSLSYYLAAGATSVRIYGAGSINYITPTVMARLEYHPQERIGISASAGYDFTTKTTTGEDWYGAKHKIMRLDNLYFEPSISVYF